MNKILLSILIPTTPDRKEQFESLRRELNKQRMDGGFMNEIEIIPYEDNKIISVGKKRDELYKMARGIYSVMWDSDDWIHSNGLQLIMEAVKKDPDCITYKEFCTIDGIEYLSNFSLEYEDWEGDGNKDLGDGFTYHRTPFFKTPIKTNLCKMIGVKDLRFGEDHDFAQKIKPHLKTEVHIKEFVYHYNHISSDFNTRYGFDK